MQPDALHYLPISHLFFYFLGGILLGLLGLSMLGTLRHAYQAIGIPRGYLFTLLLISLLGSYVNIPLAHLAAETVVSGRVVNFFGMQYVVPVVENWPGTVLAVNIGGAVVPTLLSLYLLLRHHLLWPGLAAVAAVSVAAHLAAHPVHGVGIAVPFFVPPLAATVAAVLLSRPKAAPLAYIGGSLGTLVGADLLNLDKVHGLGAPVASIGGAGTFDGIFLSAILAVLLATFLTEHGPAE